MLAHLASVGCAGLTMLGVELAASCSDLFVFLPVKQHEKLRSEIAGALEVHITFWICRCIHLELKCLAED